MAAFFQYFSLISGFSTFHIYPIYWVISVILYPANCSLIWGRISQRQRKKAHIGFFGGSGLKVYLRAGYLAIWVSFLAVEGIEKKEQLRLHFQQCKGRHIQKQAKGCNYLLNEVEMPSYQDLMWKYTMQELKGGKYSIQLADYYKMSPIQARLVKKLAQLVSCHCHKIDLSFIQGCIISSSELPYDEITKIATIVMKALIQKRISQDNFLRIVALFTLERISGQVDLLVLVKQIIDQLSIDSNYLKRKYFDEKTCALCSQQITGKSFTLLSCYHTVHPTCLRRYLDDRNIEGKPQQKIQCGQQGCGVHHLRPVLEVSLPKILPPEKFVANSIIQDEKDLSSCPTASCSAVFVQQPNQILYKCEKCNKQFCLNCKSVDHENQSCRQFQTQHRERAQQMSSTIFRRGSKFKECPKCRTWVDKAKEKDYKLRCQCGQEFDFAYWNRESDQRWRRNTAETVLSASASIVSGELYDRIPYYQAKFFQYARFVQSQPGRPSQPSVMDAS